MTTPEDGCRIGGRRHPPLIDLVGMDVLHVLQDRFAALGQVTVCVCSSAGELLAPPTWGSKFSQRIGTSAKGRKLFADALRAIARREPTDAPLACLHGMTLYAAEIRCEECPLALIVVGTRGATLPDREVLRTIATMYELDLAALCSTGRYLTAYTGATPESVHQFADGLASTIATLYDQALRIERQLSDLRIVHGITELLADVYDAQEILDVTVERVVEAMGVKACAMRLLDKDTGELVLKAVCNLSDDYLKKGPVMLTENAIDTAAFAGETVYIEDAPNDPRTRYPEMARREGIVSGLSVPMAYGGQSVGVLRVYTGRRYRFSEEEESLLESLASQAASAVINSRLIEEQAAAERVRRQMATAGEIQRRMLPPGPPTHAELRFGCAYAPTLEVGGDFYDFIDLPDDRLGVCIADVVGKGIPAALMAASVRSFLRAHAHIERDPARVIEQVNRHMASETLLSEFATLFYGVFSPDGSRFTYCNAGQTPPLLVRGATIRELRVGGLVIGIEPTETYEQESLEILAGDVLVLSTDGVIEAMNFEGTAYGQDRLLESIQRHRNLTAEQFAQQLLWDVRRFVGLAHQSDDITIVVVQVDG